MREQKSRSWVSWFLESLFQVVPYVLFYVGIYLWYVHGDTTEQFTTARYKKHENNSIFFCRLLLESYLH